MSRIFIDTERLRDLNSGLGQVCLHLGQELTRQQDETDELTFLVPPARSGVFGPDAHYVAATWWRKFWRPTQFDVWHCPHQDSAFLPGGSRTKLVLTIYDLNFLERSDYTDARKQWRLARLQRKIDRAAALTTGSDYTARLVREHLRVPTQLPVQTIYTGVAIDPAQAPAHCALADQLAGRPFFLFLGVIHPKKNVQVLLPLLEAFADYALVLAGPDGHPYAQHVRGQAQQIGVADRLLMPGAVDEPSKHWLYRHCEAFLFPSLSEGFGLPVVEAMAFGKPVFCANLTSLPEVGGREAVYWDNFEPDYVVETFRAGMLAYHDDPLKADRLRWQARRFRWDRIANEYRALYEAVQAG